MRLPVEPRPDTPLCVPVAPPRPDPRAHGALVVVWPVPKRTPAQRARAVAAYRWARAYFADDSKENSR